MNAQDMITGIIKNSLRNSAVECVWLHDSYHDKYDTQCGEAISFTTGNPLQNKYLYCPCCGGEINLR